MQSVLITGSNRGIGLEFTKQYLNDGWRVIACCRKPDSANDLQTLLENHKDSLSLHSLDVQNTTQINELAMTLQNQPIDLLINNAGVYGPRDCSLSHLDFSAWEDTLRTNLFGPMRLLTAFLSHLKKGAKKTVVNITSKMGSIGDNKSGGSYIYRTSKSALNMAMYSAAMDLKSEGITVALFHPGWVKTEMGTEAALITTKTSVGSMSEVIEKLTLKDSGSYLNYDGKTIPW